MVVGWFTPAGSFPYWCAPREGVASYFSGRLWPVVAPAYGGYAAACAVGTVLKSYRPFIMSSCRLMMSA
jgi:hypothetical protein